MHIGPLLPKWQPRLNFQNTMFWLLTNTRERWERFWRAIDLKFLADITEGRIISVGMILGAIPEVPTDDVIKYIKKAPENTKKLINGKVMNVYSIFCWGVPIGGQLLLLLHCDKDSFERRRYGNSKSQYFISIKLSKKFFFSNWYISLVLRGFYLSDKVKPSGYEIIHVYFKCILFSRHFEKNILLRFRSFNMREKESDGILP